MTAASLGHAIGRAYEPGRGMGTVFASERSGFFTVQMDGSGERLWRSRGHIQWRVSH